MEKCYSKGEVDVVALGTGYYTRSYRFAPLYTANYYEADALGTRMSKRNALRDAKIDEKEMIFLSTAILALK